MPILKALCEYKRVGACSLKADVYPAKERRAPVVLYIHGGGLIFGSRKGMPRHQLTLYWRAGFAVVSIDHRLAPETKLPGIVADIRDALRWVKDEGAALFGFDPERVAVAGSSAGAYLSLMAGTFAEKPRAIVSFYGYGDLLAAWRDTPSAVFNEQPKVSREQAWACVGGREKSMGGMDRYPFYAYCRQQGRWTLEVAGLNPAGQRAGVEPFCPVRNIGPGYPPTLLVHGDADTTVPHEQSVQMAAELAKHGVEHGLVTVPGGGHGFEYARMTPELEAILEAVGAFLQRHV